MPPRRAPPRTRGGGGAHRRTVDPNPDSKEEVLDIHSLPDSSISPEAASHLPDATIDLVSDATEEREGGDRGSVTSRRNATTEDEEDEMMEMEEVDLPSTSRSAASTDGDGNADQDQGLEMEPVDIEGEEDADADADDATSRIPEEHTLAYAAAYASASASDAGDEAESAADASMDGGSGANRRAGKESSGSAPVFKDGKGQPRGVEITMASAPKQSVKKKINTGASPRERLARLEAHKLHAVALLAHARIRNRWCNDEDLRENIAKMVPAQILTKLRAIHPKKVVSQRERVRMFESFMADLVRWWSSRFRIDPAVAGAALRQPDMDVVLGKPMAPGRRVDGWEVESPMERVKREKRERRAAQREHAQEVEEAARKEVQNKRKGKDKERESASTSAAVPSSSSTSDEKPRTTSITLFGPGSTTPLYLHILPPVEPITGPSSLIERAAMRAGSRETSAQLFTTLCRAIGVPARLVISLQVAPWSVAASKVANSSVGTRTAPKEPSSGRLPRRPPKQEARKPIDEYTSDEEGSASFEIMDEMADLSGNDPFENVARRSSARSTSLKGPVAKAKRGSASRPVSIGSGSDTGSVRSAKSKGKANPNSPAAKGKGKGKGKAKATDDASEQAEQSDRDPNDYRPAKWRNLDKIVPVKPKTRLRPQKPTKSHGAADEIEIDPNSPPVMWTEVFSKPFQRWLTVDPIRGRVEPTGNRYMEPKPTDRHNKLVYVVAFEEDGYAREVTARYARSFNGRVSKMRPPARRRGEEEWWSRVVRAIHRPQRLDRDAAEDMELADAANKEPMPASVAAFKDHPTYILERHLKRDETLFPRTEVAKFQGESVFARANVVALRSVRQWWNEGREIRDGEVPLKWVKSRGYTLANKRAEEQARAEGQEAPQEGLYARFQTEIYTSPPIVDGKIPTNAFGNIDLYVPSMLPPGAAHIPYNGAAKVAKQLGINYAEAVTGFEFKKHRGIPKVTGIVVPEEHEETVTEAFWASEHAAAEKAYTRRQERAIKNWKKLLNALRIVERVNRQYRAGDGEGGGDGQGDGKAANAEDGKQAGAAGAGSKQGSSTHAPIGTSQLRGEDDAPGGFLMDDEEEQRPVEHAQQPDTERARPRVLPARLSRDRRANEPSLSFHEQGSTPDAENGSYGEYMDADADGSADAHDGNPREGQGGQEEDAGTGTGAGTLEDFWTSTSASASASASAHEGGAQSQPTAAARIRSLHELAAAEEEMSTTPTLTQEDVPEASTMPRPDIASRDLAQKKEASGNTKRGIRTLMRKRPAGATGADGDDGEDWDGEEESLNTTLSKRPRRSASARASPAKPARASASASRRGGRAAARKSNGNGAVAVTRT